MFYPTLCLPLNAFIKLIVPFAQLGHPPCVTMHAYLVRLHVDYLCSQPVILLYPTHSLFVQGVPSPCYLAQHYHLAQPCLRSVGTYAPVSPLARTIVHDLDLPSFGGPHVVPPTQTPIHALWFTYSSFSGHPHCVTLHEASLDERPHRVTLHEPSFNGCPHWVTLHEIPKRHPRMPYSIRPVCMIHHDSTYPLYGHIHTSNCTSTTDFTLLLCTCSSK